MVGAAGTLCWMVAMAGDVLVIDDSTTAVVSVKGSDLDRANQLPSVALRQLVATVRGRCVVAGSMSGRTTRASPVEAVPRRAFCPAVPPDHSKDQPCCDLRT